MAWSYVNSGALTTSSDARSSNGGLTPALPSGTLTGKLLVCAITNVIGNGFTWSQYSGGYTQLATSSGFELWGKIATGSESAPRFDCSSASAVAGRIACFDGAPSSISGIVDTGPSYSSEFDAATAHDTSSLSAPSASGCLILYGIGGAYDGFNGATTGPSGASVAFADYFIGASNRTSLGLAYAIQTTAASVSASTWVSPYSMRSRSAVLALVPGVTLTKYLKLLADSSAASATSVDVIAFSAPSGSNYITGTTRYGSATGKSFEATLESGNAVLKIPAADVGCSGLAASATVAALARNSTYTTGMVEATIIEE